MQLDTARLVLRPLSRPEAEAVVRGERAGQPWSPGFPRDDDIDAARMLLAAAGAPGERDLGYGPYLLVLRASGLVVGSAGFFGPPDEDATVMIGYGLVPEARGQGLATEAVGGLVGLVRDDPRVRRVLAETDAGNAASRRVLEKAGFRHVDGDPDRHGFELTLG